MRRDQRFVTALLAAVEVIGGSAERGLARSADLVAQLEREPPSFALHFARMESAMGLAAHGRAEEALSLARRATQPLAGSARLQCHARQAAVMALLDLGRAEEALSETTALLGLTLAPRLREMNEGLRVLVLLELGRTEEAAREAALITTSTAEGATCEVLEHLVPLARARALLAIGDRAAAARVASEGAAEIEARALRCAPEHRQSFRDIPWPNRRLLDLARQLS
jgi:hypothetical protein